MKGCCFTGYRPEKTPFPYDCKNAEYIAFENSLIEAITKALADGFDTFYCGGAMGFDTLAAEILLLLRQKKRYKNYTCKALCRSVCNLFSAVA